MPEEAWRYCRADRPRSFMESEHYEDAASPQAEDHVRPARGQAVHARSHPVKRTKRSRSPQRRGRAYFDEGQGLYKRQKARREREFDVPTVEQMKQMSIREILAVGERLRAIGREQASRSKRFLQTCRKTCARMSRREDRVLYADMRARQIQGLREEGRQLALAHVGIHGSAIAPDGKPWRDRIITLVKAWATTWQSELSLPQKTAITNHFGSQFVSFVNTDDPTTDVVEEDGRADPYSLNMPWVERSFIMDAIDDLRPKADRDGGRIAYMAFFGCTSWKAEKRRLFNKIAPRRAHDFSQRQ